MSRRILITSALPYVNGIKHLGNLVGSLLPADVQARFQRQIGSEVLFICATDEHGHAHRDRCCARWSIATRLLRCPACQTS